MEEEEVVISVVGGVVGGVAERYYDCELKEGPLLGARVGVMGRY